MNRGKRGFSSIRHDFIAVFLVLLLVFSVGLFAGCGGGSDDSDSDSPTSETDRNTPPDDGSDSGDDSDDDSDTSGSVEDIDDLGNDYDDADYTWDSSEVATITLNGDSITENADGAEVTDDTILTISSAGTYSISGTLDDGKIIVDTDDEAVVRLIFNGIDITCSDSAPVFVADAERVAVILADSTDNYLEDGASYVYEDAEEDEPNAVLHSKDYLTIGGTGSLTVTGHYNDGITGKDGLIIDDGTITVSAPDDGIRGKDYLIVKSGTLDITTTVTGDGLLSDEEDDIERGYVLIAGGTVTIDAAEDAIQAETYVAVYDGVLDLTSGGGYPDYYPGVKYPFEDFESMKGIKGLAGVLIEGGDFTINSFDDAIHSNDFIVVEAGTFDIVTGDDGLHADLAVDIYDGDFSITDSYEGIEGAVITIDNGDFYIVSGDDGLNCAGGSDGSGFTGGRDGGMPSATDGDYLLTINGGYLAVYAQGDGLDSNGDIEMTGGTVLVHGPTGWDNGSLDCGEQGEILIDGGFLIASGSSGMVESPDNSSGQEFKTLIFDSSQSAGTLFHIETSGGADIVTFEPSKEYQSIVFSSPDLSSGVSYSAYLGGAYSGGTESDGLHEGGTYSGGSIESTFSVQ